MATPSRAVDARVVVGLGLLAVGLVISIAAFNGARSSEPRFVGDAGPSPAFGLFGGALSVTGIALLAWWSVGAWARYEVRESREEIKTVVREANAERPLACAACGKDNPIDAAHCLACGTRIAA